MSHLIDGVYTRSECNDEKYTIGQAVASARRRLNQAGIKSMCMNAIGTHRNLKTPITLQELNWISDEIYNESCYYA